MINSFRAYNRIVNRYQYFTFKDIEKQKSRIPWHILTFEQSTPFKSRDNEAIFEGDIVLDQAGRVFVVEFKESIGAFVFNYRELGDCKLYSEFIPKQLPLIIVGDKHRLKMSEHLPKPKGTIVTAK